MRARRIALLPRDPFCLFAYWDVAASDQVAVLRELGPRAQGARLVLRVFADAGGVAERVATDVEVPPGADRLYLAVADDDTDYAVALGLLSHDAGFVPLARSGVAHTPPAGPSTDTSVEWARPAPPTAGGSLLRYRVERAESDVVSDVHEAGAPAGKESREPGDRARPHPPSSSGKAPPSRVAVRRRRALSDGTAARLPAPHSSADWHGR